MFEYLLVAASTFIYLRVFVFPTCDPPKTDKGCQTEPWEALQTIDLMQIEPESELECSCTLVDWFSDSSEIELPPLVRQSSHGLKESHPKSQ